MHEGRILLVYVKRDEDGGRGVNCEKESRAGMAEGARV